MTDKDIDTSHVCNTNNHGVTKRCFISPKKLLKLVMEDKLLLQSMKNVAIYQ